MPTASRASGLLENGPDQFYDAIKHLRMATKTGCGVHATVTFAICPDAIEIAGSSSPWAVDRIDRALACSPVTLILRNLSAALAGERVPRFSKAIAPEVRIRFPVRIQGS